MNSDTLIRIKRIICRIAQAERLTPHCPVPVWDSTGTLIGVKFEGYKKMGGVECQAEATFTLNLTEQGNEDTIRRKAEIAAAAIRNEILVTIRPKIRKAG